MQSDWLRKFSITTQKLDFSQPCGFHRFPKETMAHHLKPFLFFRICIANLFKSTLGMPDKTQEKLHDQSVTFSSKPNYIQKRNFIPLIVFVLLKF